MFEFFKNLWAHSSKLEVVLDDAAYDSTNKNACESSCGIIEGNATDIKIGINNGIYSKFDRSQLPVCFKGQNILRDVEWEVVERFLKAGKLRDYSTGEKLAEQGENGDAAYFIICGSVSVVVNGRQIATREANECVGEMPIIDPARKRMADLIAAENTTVLRVTAKKWTEILSEQRQKAPLIYNMAKVFADRLRARSRFHRPPNARPRIFIGSSTEAVEIAKALRGAIETRLHAEVVDWTDNVFKLSLGNMESLERLAPTCDFALMVLSGDDRLSYRGDRVDAPRDNVIFELGFFMGVLGRTRAFFLVDKAKIPSDLYGMTYLKYSKKGKTIMLGGAIEKIQAEIQSQGVR